MTSRKRRSLGWRRLAGGWSVVAVGVLMVGWLGGGFHGCTGNSGGIPAGSKKMVFQDPDLPVAQRVADLVGRMTLAEKVGQMQQEAPAIERLGVPAYHWWNEALHGVARNGVATVFPQAIGLAATWNTPLHYQLASVISDEARAKHHEAMRHNQHGIYCGLDFWSPNINIFRDPRWGRGQETYGEDPYLTGRFGVAFVRGMQGDDPRYLKTVATPKHFAVHSGPDPERHRFDAQVSPVDLWSTYLPAFEACVREAHAASVMAAYNRLDGQPCSANPHLLQEILRERWGFTGYVVSDVDAVADVYANHQYTDTAEEAAARAVQAGCDLNGGSTYRKLTAAVGMGLLNETAIDRAVTRLMTARFRLGMFDPPDLVRYAQIPYRVNDSRAHDALAREAACQSIVLLKNQGHLLPLSKELKTLAVIGPQADSVSMLVSSYNGTPARPVTILQGLRHAVAPTTRVLYARGCPPVGEALTLEEVVPAKCLFVDATCTRPGLKADYFGNPLLAGERALTRIDPQVDFDWGKRPPSEDFPREGFGVRWTGVLVAPESGIYQLGATADDGFRLSLDGKPVVADWNFGGKRSKGARVSLEKGKAYALCLEYFQGSGEALVQLQWTRPGPEPLYAEAVRTTQAADAVVLVLGLTAELEGEEMWMNYEGLAGGDRQTLDLPRVQEELLEAVGATGKPVVLVLTSGSALAVNWAAEHVPGILAVWYPGQQGGNAVADVLFGDYNPAGRLPVTFYKSVHDLPPFEDYAMAGRTYRYFSGEPLWPFGYGLSYTTFAYRDLEVTPDRPDTAQDLTVRVKVRNTGTLAGDEVVQLYLSRSGMPWPVPLRALQGFKRLTLPAGEEKTLEFTLTPQQLAVVDPDGKRTVLPGEITIQVGGGSVGGLHQVIRLEGPAVAPAYRYVEPQVR